MKIKIITPFQFNDLYENSKSFYKDLEFEKIGVDGRNGFYEFAFFDYIMKDDKFNDCDWVIFVDEDCFITNINAMLDLLNYQINNNIHCSGVPDGGVIWHRPHNPIAINPFFSIMNVGEIKKKYNSNVVHSMMYGNDLDKHIPHNLINTIRPFHIKNTSVDYNNAQQYYKLFFWLLRNEYKILYLDAYDYVDDEWATVIKNHKGIDFAYHTWFARDWNVSANKERILKIINHCNLIKNIS